MDWYLLLKWVHIISIICWMAGILYLYRLLVNHKIYGVKSADNHALLVGMEQRLYRFITLPAMKVAVIAGLGMVGFNHAIAQTHWFMAKFVLVILLIVATVYAGILMKSGRDNADNLPPAKKLRILNEIPTVLMLIIVWLVVFKPF